MKVHFFLFFIFFVANFNFSQDILVTKSLINNNQSAIQSVSVHAPSNDIKLIKIQNFQHFSTDSLLVFEGVYNISEFDASSFYSYNFENNTHNFGLGEFEEGNYTFKILITKNDDSISEFFIQ